MNVQSALPLRPPKADLHKKAGRQDTKRRNLRTILRVVASEGATSRAEVARTTSLTRATVSTLVGDLIEDGLVIEVGHGKSDGGKPPTLIAVNRSGRDLIVADLSTSPFTGTIVDLLCDATGPVLTATQSGNHQADLDDLLDRLIDSAENPLMGIGIASPGVISDAGMVIEATNLEWHNHPLAEHVRARTGLPVTAINDAHASAVAARHRLESTEDRSDRHDTDLLFLRIAKGVGAGVILSGELHLGSHRAAGEIGHAVLDPDGPACSCGNNGCVETMASSYAIYERIAGSFPADANWSVQELEESVGKELVDTELTRAGMALGTVVSYLVNALDVSRIVISMQPAEAGERLAKAAEAALMPRVLPALRSDLEVRAVNGDDLALRGVASIVISREFGLTAS